MHATSTHSPPTPTTDPFTDTGGADVVPQLHGHIPALDGLRGLAIAFVLLVHFIPHRDQASSLLGRGFLFVAHAGWSGVDLFFVLSGFLITGILLDAKGTGHYLRNFYARRTLRIFPLYYGVLAAFFVVLPVVWPAGFASPEVQAVQHRQGWLWAYLTNVAMTRWNDTMLFSGGWLNFGPFWSLAVEEHFYLVWPALVLLLSRRGLGWASATLVVASAVLRGVLAWHGYEDSVYVFTPCRWDALSIGALITLLMRSPSAASVRGALVRNVRWIAAALGVATAATLVVDPSREALWNITGGYTLIAVFFAALLVQCVTASPRTLTHRLFTSRPMMALGKYSYGIYVYHVVLASAMDRLFGQRQLEAAFRAHGLGRVAYGASVLLYIALASLFSFAAAWLSWQVFEKQFLKLKRFFEYREPAINPKAP